MEWKTDGNGRKYRKVGTTIEYAPTVMTASGGEVYADELEAHNQRMKQQAEARIAAEREKLKQEPTKICPVKIGRNTVRTRCDGSCVLYDDTACMLARATNTAVTSGKICPIAGRACIESCALYSGGCSLVGMIAGRE